MTRTMLIGKIHAARVTGVDLDYEGSIAVDSDLLDAADILPGEQVHVWNCTNGNRLVTYAIKAPSGSGQVALNGGAARSAMPGDRIVIAAFGQLSDEQARDHRPRVILMLGDNNIVWTTPR